MARGSKPGEYRGGRKKGTPNKSTAAVKAALVDAFDQLGGVGSLVKWGKKNPTEFYKLWSKLLPTEIKNADGEKLRIEVVEEIRPLRVMADRLEPFAANHHLGEIRLWLPLAVLLSGEIQPPPIRVLRAEPFQQRRLLRWCPLLAVGR